MRVREERPINIFVLFPTYSTLVLIVMLNPEKKLNLRTDFSVWSSSSIEQQLHALVNIRPLNIEV